jgi:hypothetical protein
VISNDTLPRNTVVQPSGFGEIGLLAEGPFAVLGENESRRALLSSTLIGLPRTSLPFIAIAFAALAAEENVIIPAPENLPVLLLVSQSTELISPASLNSSRIASSVILNGRLLT